MLTSDDSPTLEWACVPGISTENRQDDSTGLMGTTEQRESLRREQDIEYELSLKADREKRIAFKMANAEAQQKKRLQEARAT